MRFKEFIFSLTFLTLGCDGNNERNDDELISKFPSVSSTSPSDLDTIEGLSSAFSVTFTMAMDTTSLTTNTSDTSCSGTFQVSSDSFSTCVQMSSSPTASNSNKTFSITPSSNLTYNTPYKIRVTTGVKNTSGLFLANQYEMINGFTHTALFVVVGDAGTILTSSDGISWASRTSGLITDLTTVYYAKNTFVAKGGVHILTSSDGTSWTHASSTSYPLPDNNDGFIYGNNIFVRINDYFIESSSDGTSWTWRAGQASTRPYLAFTSLTFGNSIFVATGNLGDILTSSDGISWTTRASGTHGYNLISVLYGNGTFVAFGVNYDTWRDDIILTSSDGISWSKQLGARGSYFFLGNNFFILGDDGSIFTSSDGTSWKSWTTGTLETLNGVAYPE